MLDGRVRDALILLVAVGWVASIIGQIFNPNYEPDPSVNASFALVIGAALGLGKKESNSKDRNEEKDDTPRKGR